MDDVPLLDEDDDLLDYFFSDDLVNQGQSVGALGQDQSGIEQVNDSMASLLFSGNEMGGQPNDFLDPMMFDASMDLMPNSDAPATEAQTSTSVAKPKPKAKTKTSTAKTKKTSVSARKPAKSKPRAKSAKTTDDIGKKKGSTSKKGTTAKAKNVKISDGAASAQNDAEDKRLRRLARNRESARQSRRRKKEHLELLEEKVAQLTNELDQLRRQYMEQADQSLQEQRLNSLANLSSLIEAENSNDDSVQRQIRQRLMEMEALYGINSEEQQRITDYHYKHLFSLILPTYSKYFVWMLNQGERFFDDLGTDGKNGDKRSADYGNRRQNGGKSVWRSFSNELHLTQDQQEKLKSDFKQQHAEGPKMERQKLSNCINILEQLRTKLFIRSKVVETHSRALYDILTPEQTVKYLLWAEENRDRISQCNLGDLIIRASSPSAKGEGMMRKEMNPVDARLQAAAKVLEKPESDMQLNDLQILLAALDG
mmetsp:Transcript_1639/g.1980  ORF Transcript_1639/g.1980 Transcript_1639/m.1980 type:complete len:481 (+) Transcript_1639:202-1644(+)